MSVFIKYSVGIFINIKYTFKLYSMKTIKIFLTFVVALFTTVAFSQVDNFTSTLMTNANTAHNFATGDGGGNGGYTFALSTVVGDGNGVCVVCHTPHNADLTADIPLWDHAASGETFTPYPSGGTIDGTITAPAGASLMCLGCHDGTANLDAYGASANPAGTLGMNAGDVYAEFGADLTNDHPISITYPADVDAVAQQMVLGSTLAAGFLYSNKVECASCHGMHNPAVILNLLRTTNDNSLLCLTCHVK